MAGEWIPVDCNLGTKPEVLAVVAATGEPIEVVVGRMVRLWAWAWHVTADGTIRVPRAMLPSVAGGDESFWCAVEKAGWLACTDDTVTIPGWEERFSNAAKRRLLDARLKSVRRLSARHADKSRTDCGLEERRGEEIRGEEKKYTHTPRTRGDDDEFRKPGWAGEEWASFVAVWNATAKAAKWTPLVAPDGWVDAAASPGWLQKARLAVERLPRCLYFDKPLAVTQLLQAGWVDRIIGGEFDNPRQKPSGRAGGGDFGGTPPPPKAFAGKDAAAFEATRRAMEARRKEATA